MIRGVLYPSQRAAARAVGVSCTTVFAALERCGSADAVGLGRDGVRPKPITIRGVDYPSITAAARAIGVSHAAILKAQKNGRLDTVGLKR